MPRTKPRGLPAASILAGGITRHGPHCGCAYCAPYPVSTANQSIPVIAATIPTPPTNPDNDSLVSVEACS